MSWTATEVMLMLATAGTSFRWWIERRDARSALAVAKTEADKTVTTLKEAVVELESEAIDLKAQHQADREAWSLERGQYIERINHLEDRLDRVGGSS